MVNIRQNICPSNKWSIKCPYTMVPEAITVHNTANDASANNEIAYMIRNEYQTSFHFAVDDIEVVQGISLNRNAWHAGDGGNGYGNRKTIGIEICYSKSGGPKFDQAERNAAWLIAKLLKERGWGLDRVGTHQMRSGKYCPHRTLDYGWNRFKDMIQKELNEMNKPTWQWTPIDNPRTMRAKGNINIYEIPTLKVLGTIADGADTPFVQKVNLNNETYLRSAWSRDHNKNNGVLIDDLAELPTPEPTPNNEASSAPNDGQSSQTPEPEQTNNNTQPPTPPNEEATDEAPIQSRTWWQIIIGFIKSIFNYKTKGK